MKQETAERCNWHGFSNVRAGGTKQAQAKKRSEQTRADIVGLAEGRCDDAGTATAAGAADVAEWADRRRRDDPSETRWQAAGRPLTIARNRSPQRHGAAGTLGVNGGNRFALR
ncbi:MAG: hypothetical protein ACM3XZ_00850 [Betaproteobacteria bacterium]